MTVNEYLDYSNLTPDVIAKSTNLSLKMIEGLINGDVDIMSISFESILLLTRCLKLPLSDVVGYFAEQRNTWKITIEDEWYYLSFPFGGHEIRLQLAPVDPMNTKYIKIIAAVNYEAFLDGIIDAKRGQVSVYRKQVVLELKKLDAIDIVIQLIDDDDLEELLDAGRTPQEAAAILVMRTDEE